MMKTCTKCGIEKNDDCFGKHRRQCKECRKAYKKTRDAQYYLENREAIIVRVGEYVAQNKGAVEEYQKLYHSTHKEQRNARQSLERKNNPHEKIKHNVSNLIRLTIQRQGSSKNGNSIINHLGYTIEDLKKHLEQQFEPWMTWNNWGKYDPATWNDSDQFTWTWQLDHIIPQSDLPYTSMTDDNFQKCWALSNLRPYSAKLNVLEKNRRS